MREIDDKKAKGIGVFTVDGKMIDIAFYDGAKRTLAMRKAAGVYEGICKMINKVGRNIPEEILKATGKRSLKAPMSMIILNIKSRACCACGI